MKSLKQNVEQMIRNLPDDSTVEDIQYHLYVMEKIRRGLDRADTENTLTQEEAEDRLKKWTSA